MRRIETVLLLLLLACALPLQAQIRGSEIQVNVVPDPPGLELLGG